jgi:predicted nucleic acid-binding Zn ribbon protein
MQSLSTLLVQSYQARVEQTVVLDDQTLFYVFRKIIAQEYGARGAAHLQARYCKDKKLFVAATSSLWAQEIHLARHSLMQLLNAELGQEAIQDIKVEHQFA